MRDARVDGLSRRRTGDVDRSCPPIFLWPYSGAMISLRTAFRGEKGDGLTPYRSRRKVLCPLCHPDIRKLVVFARLFFRYRPDVFGG